MDGNPVDTSIEELEFLRMLDEVFQVCVFLHVYAGLEKFGIDDIARMVGANTSVVLKCIDLLVNRGYIRIDGDLYTLTDEGLQEAEKKFMDEFRFFHGSAHGFCNDPDCECHTGDPASCSIHSSEKRIKEAARSWKKGLRISLPRRGSYGVA
ncbi:MAG: winged helix-turn-helix domain-containing protein [Desulfurococcales archaeon]|nr:winged helix-turn-helix domain-containing protein [Desulfurococcales archaeon]